jgi:hypothetical protein
MNSFLIKKGEEKKYESERVRLSRLREIKLKIELEDIKKKKTIFVFKQIYYLYVCNRRNL